MEWDSGETGQMTEGLGMRSWTGTLGRGECDWGSPELNTTLKSFLSSPSIGNEGTKFEIGCVF